MKKQSLFNITEEILTLDEMLDDVDGDVSDGAEAIVAAFLAETDTALEAKVEGYCQLIGQKKATAKARKAEADRITALAKADVARASFLTARLKEAFETLGISKLETATHRVSIAKNGGLLAMEYDEAFLRANPGSAYLFEAVDPKLNVAALREAVELEPDIFAGIASFKPRGSSLRIK